MYENITLYINNSISSGFLLNCEFHYFEKQKDNFMHEELYSYLGVVNIKSLKCGDELLVAYNYRKEKCKPKISKKA